MNSAPLVSIVVPFRNTELFLDEMIESVVNQTYRNWELILVNDRSTDDSYDVVEEWCQHDSRISVYESDGKGIIPALQLAYSHAKGDLVSRMDSDDRMRVNRIEVMVKQLLDYGKGGISIGQVKYFSKSPLGEGFQNYETWLNSLTAKGANFSELYKECVIPSPCWMVWREDFDNCGGFSPHRYPEDYDLVFRFFESGLKCIPNDEVLHDWRDYPVRASRTDPNYADNTFMDLKIHYFLKLHKDPNRPLVVWGAGAKGKRIALECQQQNIEFHWVCDNPKKIGKEIYGMKMLPFIAIDDYSDAQNIITVANPKAQEEIQRFFGERNKQPLEDYFFFC